MKEKSIRDIDISVREMIQVYKTWKTSVVVGTQSSDFVLQTVSACYCTCKLRSYDLGRYWRCKSCHNVKKVALYISEEIYTMYNIVDE